MPTVSNSRVAYLCTDLLFTSKIRETARALGQECSAARDVGQLVDAARGAHVVIVDLRLPFALEALARLRSDPATAEVPAVGFCDHERIELMEEARRAGCQTVLAKGKFSSSLRHVLETGRTEAEPALAIDKTAPDAL